MKSKYKCLVGLSALILLASACSDDADGGQETDGGEVTSTTADQQATPAEGDPVRVGFVNLEGGPVSVPEIRLGAEAAAEYVNSELGGIAGRPLEYVRCDSDGSPENAIDCANQMVEAEVVAVQLGVVPGADGMLPILESAGIPVIGHSPFGEAQQTDEDAFYFGAPVAWDAAGPLGYFADEGAESVTFFLPEDPSMRAADEDILQPTAESLDLDYNTIFYDVANPDWNVLSTTAMADGPDVIGSPVAGEPDCIGFIGALRSAGFGGQILAGNCSMFVSVLGEQAAGVVTTSGLWRPDDADAAPEDKQAEIAEYLAAMDAAGHAEIANGFSYFFFSDTVNLARALADVDGAIDGSVVKSVLTEADALESFMGPVLDCAAAKAEGLTACSHSQLIYEVDADGEQTALTDEFLDLNEIIAE